MGLYLLCYALIKCNYTFSNSFPPQKSQHQIGLAPHKPTLLLTLVELIFTASLSIISKKSLQ